MSTKRWTGAAGTTDVNDPRNWEPPPLANNQCYDFSEEADMLPLAVSLANEINDLNLWHIEPEIPNPDEAISVQFTKTAPGEFVPLIDARVRPLVEALRAARDVLLIYEDDSIRVDEAVRQIDAALKAAGAEIP